MEVRKENYTIKTDGLIIKKNKGTEESLLSKSNQWMKKSINIVKYTT